MGNPIPDRRIDPLDPDLLIAHSYPPSFFAELSPELAHECYTLDGRVDLYQWLTAAATGVAAAVHATAARIAVERWLSGLDARVAQFGSPPPTPLAWALTSEQQVPRFDDGTGPAVGLEVDIARTVDGRYWLTVSGQGRAVHQAFARSGGLHPEDPDCVPDLFDDGATLTWAVPSFRYVEVPVTFDGQGAPLPWVLTLANGPRRADAWLIGHPSLDRARLQEFADAFPVTDALGRVD